MMTMSKAVKVGAVGALRVGFASAPIALKPKKRPGQRPAKRQEDGVV